MRIEFNQLVQQKMVPLLEGHGFLVVDQRENYFHFKSAVAEATVSYNELDRSSFFEIGKANEFLYPVTDNLIERVFGLDIKVDQVTKETFVDNIVLFLQNGGSSLLNGDERKSDEIKKFTEEESKAYTSRLLENQEIPRKRSKR